MILIDDGIMERIVDAFNEANDIVGFVNTARLSDSDIVESDLEGNKKSYSYRNFLLTLDDLINDRHCSVKFFNKAVTVSV